MGKLRKIGKKIGRGIKKIGKKFKKGLGKIARAFGKLGPLGSIALSFILPGVGTWISGLAQGSSFLAPIAKGLVNAGNWIKNGVGRVFNKVTDAIEWSMNKVSGIVPGGEGQFGTKFRNWVSETTNGFIEPSTAGVEDITVPGQTKIIQGPEGPIKVEVPETTISADAQLGIGGPKVPQTPKGMTEPVYIDGIDTDLKKGFYEKADLDAYYKGVDTAVDIGAGTSIDITGSNIGMDVGPSSPIRAVDRATIKTTGDLKAPKPVGKGLFGRAKKAYTFVQPVQSVGEELQAQKDAEELALQQTKDYNREYYTSFAQDTMGGYTTQGYQVFDLGQEQSDADIYRLMNGYSGILGA